MIKKKGNSKPVEVKQIKMKHLFYMSTMEVTAKQLSEVFSLDESISIEVWDALDIMELELKNKNNVDFEPMDINFDHPDDQAFLQEHSIKAIYAITLKEEDLDGMMKLFKSMVERFGGLVCTDSEDFMPRII